MSLLGSGGFGTVYSKNGMAIKQFKKLSHLLQEVSVTVYMRDSKYTLNVIECDFARLTMTTELWHCSLQSAMVKHRFTFDEKMSIFKDILKGLCCIHSYFLIHADLRSANILVNKQYNKAIIADFGLASIDDCAKVRQTARPFQPMDIVNETSHDMYGLAVTMTELFGDTYIGKKLPPLTLEAVIRNRVVNTTIKNALIDMIPGKNGKCANESEILSRVFGLKPTIPVRPAYCTRNKLTEEVNEYIKEKTRKIGERFVVDNSHKTRKIEYGKVNKLKRCIQCIVFFLNVMYRKEAGRIKIGLELDLTIKCMLFIFSSVFGGRGYTENTILHSCKECKLKHIHHVLSQILSHSAVIDLIFAP